MSIKPLEPSHLCHRCDPKQFKFKTTDDLEDLPDVIGQPRAVEAIGFGMVIERDGYNIFALGAAGTGKYTLVRRFFERQAKDEPVPSDWCYVNSFEQTHKPDAIQLPPGRGVELREDMEHLVDGLQAVLSAAFESEEYQTQRQVITQEFQDRQGKAFEELQEVAKEHGVALIRTPAGLAVAPVHEGEVMTPEQVQELSEEERKKLEAKVNELQGELQKVLRLVPGWQREMRERIDELSREMANVAVGDQLEELRAKYAEFERVVDYLNDVQKDVVENARDLLSLEGETGPGQQGGGHQRPRGESPLLRRYRVNVLVDNGELEGAPVVHEDNPTYQNLIGRMENIAQMGALLTDYNLIKPGALHRANGGYLILDARKVLLQPYSWEGLERALQYNQVRIESVGQMLSLISTVSLEPEPIPLNVKVALLGDPLLYYMLWQADPDFGELFKVTADFDERMERNAETQMQYARMIATMARKEGLRPFDREAVARVIERSARMVGDSQKLSTRMHGIIDLLREADYWAERSGNGVVKAADVQKAIDTKIYRSDRLRERVQEGILRGSILIDTTGEKVGQINGLSVVGLGGFAFGRPTRITAGVRMGEGSVVDIEREVELGGPIHSKGVLILTGFLGARYARERPLSLSASLVFEQSYGGVEGDSASSAELYALLSAISGVPVKQSLAVTGSVNQYGQVQVIGGVNEKIEGFYDLCNARGLSGEQGVLIPVGNVEHLMLRQDVIEAVEQAKFHIYPIETIDQGIEVLTGVPAGEMGEDGAYPEGSINCLVERRLTELAEKRAEFKSSKGSEGKES
jgi:lon-related putative ATP-dependent protease